MENSFEEYKTEEPKIEEPKRSSTPPKKSNGSDAWFSWYEEEIRERIANGQTFDKIKKELKITHVEKFLNNER
jgi:hypothetical protein